MGVSRSVFRLLSVAIIMTQTGCSDKVSESRSSSVVAADTVAEIPTDPFEPITMRSDSGLSVSWLRFGATLHDVRLPDGTSILAAPDDPEAASENLHYVGTMIGRVANRIEGARFTLDGQDYTVADVEAGHALHGGPDGFDTVVWDASWERGELVFRHTSPDGHQGYPGNLDVTVRARLSDRELRLRIVAITDAPTPVNITHHGYWNPSGQYADRIGNLRLQSTADRYLPTNEDKLPTGDILPVEVTPFDFRQGRLIGDAAFDHMWLVPGEGLKEMARVSDGVRSVTVLSDYPGFQLFTGETLGDVTGNISRGAVALETQYPPNAVNRPIEGHNTILRPGEVYRHTIIYRFDGPGFGDEQE